MVFACIVSGTYWKIITWTWGTRSWGGVGKGHQLFQVGLKKERELSGRVPAYQV
jgi:hypothetical protein